MNKIYKPKEVAEILNVGYNKVLDMIHLGQLSAYKIGGEYRISDQQVLRYLHNVRVKSPWVK